ncbi:hypothetical protein PGQ11_005385 [Apiospora arundinis]|uniref:Serine/threonine-protein kinase ppk6 n=1 Tax=Apiospora arundinis TaxID=335852 RepID=A0ABR2JBD1_9PEZI
MSADLFAEFESPPASQTPQAASTSSDPFDFSSFAPNKQSAPAPPPSQQQSQPWPAFQSTPDPWATSATTTSTAAPIPQGTGTIGNDNDDDDEGWGDFEVAQTTKSVPSPTPPIPTGNVGRPSQDVLRPSQDVGRPSQDIPVRTRIVRADTIDLLSNSLIDIPDARRPAGKFPLSQKPKPKLEAVVQNTTRKAPNPDPDVLFDADDFDGDNPDDDDDDFGEFETVTSPVQEPANLISNDLLVSPPATTDVRSKKPTSQMLATLNLQGHASNYPQAPKSPSFQERNPFPGLALQRPAPTPVASKDNPKTSPITAWPSMDRNDSAGSNAMDDGWGNPELTSKPKITKDSKAADDDWGDWDAFDSSKPVSTRPASAKPAPAKPISAKPEKLSAAPQDIDSSWDWDGADLTLDESKDDGNQVPPSNIPPPSVLLSIFPQLLGMANTSLYKPVSGQPFSIKNRIMSDPRTVEFLKGYMSLATVAARIIAGRKQRWHRDKFLAQSMSISAAGSKGMKLAGVDKTQAARDDREAGDVLDVWKEHVGRLRSAIAAANSTLKDQHLKIPELRDNMQVQAAKGVPTSAKACVICGLRRDERVARVDFDVEDSFGEWWAEHWGHLACKRFWLKHENALRQR